MASLDSFLNVAIPIGIVVFFVGLLYVKMSEPINKFFAWIKSLFSSASEQVPDVTLPTEIVYYK